MQNILPLVFANHFPEVKHLHLFSSRLIRFSRFNGLDDGVTVVNDFINGFTNHEFKNLHLEKMILVQCYILPLSIMCTHTVFVQNFNVFGCL